MTSAPALGSLPRAWLFVELRGYREQFEDHTTYSSFAYEQLPPVSVALDADLAWLRREPRAPGSLADERDATPARPATEEQLAELVRGTDVRVPQAFATFVASSALQSRIRSCTACYLDLGNVVVPAGDGTLVHFLSDQQWALHWLLFCGTNGREAVVVTDRPLGFVLPDGDLRELDEPEVPTAVCAESFSEFLYRFRIENEIWFALESEPRALTPEELAYVGHYAQLAAS